LEELPPFWWDVANLHEEKGVKKEVEGLKRKGKKNGRKEEMGEMRMKGGKYMEERK
jgi:hypothetical protein